MKCLIIQPIHAAGLSMLETAGIEVVQASAHDMETVAREIASCDAAITRNAGLSRAAMVAATRLKVLGNHGIGTDPVDVAFAGEIGLPIVFTPYANVQSVAELVITHMLAIARRVREADTAVREGRFDYRYSRDFHELSGKTLAIIGFGRIGQRTAEIAQQAFGMRVVVYSPNASAASVSAAGFENGTDLDAVLGAADYVSLHQRLTPATRGLFNRERLLAMKKGAALINTARGAIVDVAALNEVLESGHLRGAAFDVFEQEPPPKDTSFSQKLILAPHIGGSTEEALERTATQVATQVIDVLQGRRPENLVNPEIWDRRRAA